jgi:hypothetical protein
MGDMKRRECHVCKREAGILKDGRIAKHYRRNPDTGRRELCLGIGQMYRQPIEEVKAWMRSSAN